MGARRLTNKAVAEKAGVGVMTVSRIRNGDANVGYMMLKKVVEALGLTIAEVSERSEVELKTYTNGENRSIIQRKSESLPE